MFSICCTLRIFRDLTWVFKNYTSPVMFVNLGRESIAGRSHIAVPGVSPYPRVS